jgi:hypothetical protein
MGIGALFFAPTFHEGPPTNTRGRRELRGGGNMKEGPTILIHTGFVDGEGCLTVLFTKAEVDGMLLLLF